ncbi:MAG TPA: hypothetical protein VFA39_17055 [Steroidobacteraceae bacterium]|nr:hypothetical protein [Steroidobacteraceae bacterium]
MAEIEFRDRALPAIEEDGEARRLNPEEARIARESLAAATKAGRQLDVRVTQRPKSADPRQLIEWTTYVVRGP